MKTAVSIPDQLFSHLERQREKLGISRSELIQRALEQWLENQGSSDLTARYNAVADEVSTSLTPAERKAQRRALPPERW